MSKKFISQQERMKYFRLSPEQEEKINKQKDLEEWCCEKCKYKFFTFGSIKVCEDCDCWCHDEKRDWEKVEATLDKENITELIIKPNQFNFLNNKLIIKDYPNLKTLYACGLKLKEIELDCPSLENLYLTGNVLETIDLSKTRNLKNLLVNENNLKELEVKYLKNLEDLRCNKNGFKKLDVRDLQQLKIVDVSHNGLKKIMLDNNPSLEILDIGENIVTCMDFPPLPNLRMLSLRSNFYYKKIKGRGNILLRSPKQL